EYTERYLALLRLWLAPWSTSRP
ncbi:hypothetical protein AB1N83_013918, partial [Pleurotus pulmonarius]